MMSNTAKASLIRVGVGGALILAAIAMAVFVFPDAKAQQRQQAAAAEQAKKLADQQRAELKKLKERDKVIEESRQKMDAVLSSLSHESEGMLKWKLRKALHELGTKHGVHIQSIKYGSSTREGAKGTDLESIDVELASSGVYKSVKTFMLALETSNLPFGISNGRLDEGPDGLRMTLTLRAFRRSGAAPKSKEAA